MAAAKPEILLLQLGDAMQVNLFDELYSSIQEKFEAHYIVVKKRNAAEIIEFLSTAAPLTKAILAVDGGLSKKKNKGVQTKLHQYAERGGTVLLCCIFSSFVRPTDFKVMSQNMSLGWEWGDYHRTVFALSPAFKSVFGSDAFATLETAYSMKAVHLKGVAPEAKIYVPTDDSRVQSAVFPPGKVDTTQCPAAFQKHRDGFVGFVGDVNNETGSQALIMAMLSM